jgi:predicted nucleotidyltransferase/HEPN domain-containing protein
MIQAKSDAPIPFATIERAASTLRALVPQGSDVILFGSYARGDAGPESDVDFLVVEPTLRSRRAEMVRLRQALRPLRIPVDVLVVGRAVFDEWKALPNNVIYEANREGRIMGATPTPAQLSLSKARDDLYLAEKAKDDEKVTIEQVGFLCQQAIEKSLKAVLAHHAVRYHRGHDLANYLDLLKAANVAYPAELEKGTELTPFGAQLRYDYLPPEEEAAMTLDRQEMYRVAESAIAWATGIVPGI